MATYAQTRASRGNGGNGLQPAECVPPVSPGPPRGRTGSIVPTSRCACRRGREGRPCVVDWLLRRHIEATHEPVWRPRPRRRRPAPGRVAHDDASETAAISTRAGSWTVTGGAGTAHDGTVRMTEAVVARRTQQDPAQSDVVSGAHDQQPRFLGGMYENSADVTSGQLHRPVGLRADLLEDARHPPGLLLGPARGLR